MKLNLLQFMAFSAGFGWVMGEICQLDYASCVALAGLGFVLAGYNNDAHKKMYRWVFKK